jgi:Transposase IS116/IS110/IS902 family
MLGRIDSIDADIAAVDEQIAAHLAPFAEAAARLDEIPGIGPIAAAAIIAEIGLDMSRFPTAGHLCSWAKFHPGINKFRRHDQRQRSHRPRQPLPGPHPRRGRRRGRQNRHLRRGHPRERVAFTVRQMQIRHRRPVAAAPLRLPQIHPYTPSTYPLVKSSDTPELVCLHEFMVSATPQASYQHNHSTLPRKCAYELRTSGLGGMTALM